VASWTKASLMLTCDSELTQNVTPTAPNPLPSFGALIVSPFATHHAAIASTLSLIVFSLRPSPLLQSILTSDNVTPYASSASR
jgi:hypothetical protein